MMSQVLLLGLPDEPPLALAAAALARLGIPFVMWDQRKSAQSRVELQVDDRGVSGWLVAPQVKLRLNEVCGVYSRLADWSVLPEHEALDPADPVARHAATLHERLNAWLECTPALVVNRLSCNESNNSKPLQMQCIRSYFHVPPTCVTNVPADLRAFLGQHGRCIYKSISGERSIVSEYSSADEQRLHLLRSAPVQLQALLSGFDVRVHVVGSEVFATRVWSRAVDYRYDPDGAEFSAFELPGDVEQACIQLSRACGLELAGIDLRFADDGRIYCFEVNPSPAYSVYEEETGQPIAEALALHLARAGVAVAMVA